MMFPHDYIQGLYLWQKITEEMLCSFRCILCGIQNLIWPISSEVNLNHMIELVSARFFHCEVPFSPFLFNQCWILFQLVVFLF